MNEKTEKQAAKKPAYKTEKVTLSNTDKLGFISNLSTMLSAGIPILEAIDSLKEDSKGGQKKLLDTLGDDLIQGKRVYYSFGRFPRIFDKVTINIIKASEEAGTLDETLKDLVETIKKETEFNDRIRSAMVYPIFILFVFIGMMLMILVVVVPKIATVFLRLKAELPMPTKVMIFLSDLLLKNTLLVIISTIVIVAVLYFIGKQNKQFFTKVFTSLPLISKLSREIDVTRFTRSLHLLLNAGIPITTALELSEEVVSKKEVGKAIKHAKEVVASGKKLSEGFKEYKKIYPPIMIKITEAGEKSGSLDKAMLDASEFLDYQVSKTLKTVTTLIEPLMLVLVGLMVGAMMLAIIAPIYSMIGDISPR